MKNELINDIIEKLESEFGSELILLYVDTNYAEGVYDGSKTMLEQIIKFLEEYNN